ncbi:Ubiquitin-specific protease [Phaffia rhodozyma]|uniref:Ubiquitin carboxyl-terminal hydrolase n=1 Tax=Phaffia rhodozyma TaxID=264483 RepID=A0A0F7SSL0_PHARH|nr:Ubiquitin-specific protease [Phaffia rhodozyma]
MLGRSRSIRKTSSLSAEDASSSVVDRTDEQDVLIHQPTGLINDGNTCYLNSVFQSLIHTPPFSTLLVPVDVKNHPYSPPSTITIDRARCPAFMADRNEHIDLMPLAAAFIENAGRSWRTELKGLQPGAGDRKGQGLKTLLYSVSRKYDQYGDYEQQDAHEFLRHLLDSIRMEECDVIKRLKGASGNPTISNADPRHISTISTPSSISPAPPSSEQLSNPSDATNSPVDTIESPPSADLFPNIVIRSDPVHPEQEPHQTNTSPAAHRPDYQRSASFDDESRPTMKDLESISNEQRNQQEHKADMVSFVDLLFGGRLASMVVCESCKSVSHTYEDFMDLSMSLPEEEPRERKRDRLKSIASKWKAKLTKPDNYETNDSSAVASDDEDDDGPPPAAYQSFASRRMTNVEEGPKRVPGGRRMTVDAGNQPDNLGPPSTNLGRRGSIFGGIGRKKSISSLGGSNRRASIAQSEAESAKAESTGSRASSPGPGDEVAGNGSALSTTTGSSINYANAVLQSQDSKFPKVRPSQAAYILRILGPYTPTQTSLSKRVGSSSFSEQAHSSPNLITGLTDCLKQFTAVEVLEGDNAFACKKCWRWDNPRADGKPWRRGGEHPGDDDEEDDVSVTDGLSGENAGSGGGLGSITDVDEATEHVATLKGTDLAALEAMTLNGPVEETGYYSEIASQGPAQAISGLPPTGLSNGYHGTIPTISQTPLSPETELSTIAPSVAPHRSKSSLAPPVVKINHRPANTRGISFTQHQNPELETMYVSDSDDSEDDASSNGGSPVGGGPKYVLRRAFKRYLIVHPPAILVIHLKRFEQIFGGKGFNPFGGFATNFRKLDSYVSFPEVLDIAPFLAPARVGAPVTQLNASRKIKSVEAVSDAVLYQLCAVVVHIGSMGGGHYVSYVLSSPSDPPPLHTPSSSPQPPKTGQDYLSPSSAILKPQSSSSASSIRSETSTYQKDPRVWYYCSDTVVKKVEIDEVLRAGAYLIFYEKT